MSTLIAFEFKKFFRKKKNLIGIVIFIIFTLIYILINSSLEQKRLDYEITSCNQEIKSVQETLFSLKNEENNNKSGNDAKLANIKTVINSYKNQLNLLDEKRDAITKYDWNTKLNVDLQLDKNLIQGINQGYIVTSENPKEIQARIQENEILFNKNIKPIYVDCSMEAYNFWPCKKFCVN